MFSIERSPKINKEIYVPPISYINLIDQLSSLKLSLLWVDKLWGDPQLVKSLHDPLPLSMSKIWDLHLANRIWQRWWGQSLCDCHMTEDYILSDSTNGFSCWAWWHKLPYCKTVCEKAHGRPSGKDLWYLLKGEGHTQLTAQSHNHEGFCQQPQKLGRRFQDLERNAVLLTHWFQPYWTRSRGTG